MPTRPPTFHQQRQTAGGPTIRRPEHRGSAASRGYDGAWAKLRLAHLQVHPLCVFCQGAATIADHVVPIAHDPTRRLDPTNLRSVCVDCHAQLTANLKKYGRNEMTGQPQEARAW